MSYLEIKELLERQLRRLADRSKGADDATLAALSEQMVNVGKFLVSVTPADEKRR